MVSGTTSATLTEYALSTGAIGSATATLPLTVPGFAGDTILPTGVAVLANSNAVYVTAYDKSAYNPGGSTTSNANPGWLFGYAVGSGGALTPVSGSPYQAGVKPSALATDPISRFVYVTDFASNELIGYAVLSTDALHFMVNGPFKTGNEPTFHRHRSARHLHLPHQLARFDSVGLLHLPAHRHALHDRDVSLDGRGNTTDTEPVSIVVDPALGRYVYTANYLGNSISGFQLNPSDGTIEPTQATPYPTGANPTSRDRRSARQPRTVNSSVMLP